MKLSHGSLLFSLTLALGMLFPQHVTAQYQFGFLSYKKALQSMPEYPQAQQSITALKQKYDNEANYNEEKFKKMFADFLDGQKNFPQEIMLKRQKELQVGMEQGIAFRKDAQRLLSKAEDELMAPMVAKLDSILAIIGRENGFIFIVNTDNKDFPFIHDHAGKDLNEIVAARIAGRIIPINEPTVGKKSVESGTATPAENTSKPADNAEAPATPTAESALPNATEP